MAYGHAERNLAVIRQLEAETRQLLGGLPQRERVRLAGPGDTAAVRPQDMPVPQEPCGADVVTAWRDIDPGYPVAAASR
jgi:hypothetical protein